MTRWGYRKFAERRGWYRVIGCWGCTATRTDTIHPSLGCPIHRHMIDPEVRR